jgi:hypothetical protein
MSITSRTTAAHSGSGMSITSRTTAVEARPGCRAHRARRRHAPGHCRAQQVSRIGRLVVVPRRRGRVRRPQSVVDSDRRNRCPKPPPLTRDPPRPDEGRRRWRHSSPLASPNAPPPARTTEATIDVDNPRRQPVRTTDVDDPCGPPRRPSFDLPVHDLITERSRPPTKFHKHQPNPCERAIRTDTPPVDRSSMHRAAGIARPPAYRAGSVARWGDGTQFDAALARLRHQRCLHRGGVEAADQAGQERLVEVAHQAWCLGGERVERAGPQA